MSPSRLVPFTIVVAFAAFQGTGFAEIPKKTRAELSDEASNAFTGVVKRTYERKDASSKKFEYTYGVAEISVTQVHQGDEIQSGDTVFVRYWRKRWIGDGRPAPDHYGHWNLPEEKNVVVVFVKGNRRSGYDALSPNGFYERISPSSSSDGNKNPAKD